MRQPGVADWSIAPQQLNGDRNAKRPKMAKLASNDELGKYVQDRLSGLINAGFS
jgi:hypothetical protein